MIFGVQPPSDDAVLAQGRDCGSVEAEPIGEHFGGMLSEQRCRLDLGRDAIKYGRRGLVDLVALMGNYAATAALLTAFGMQLDPGQAPPLPMR